MKRLALIIGFTFTLACSAGPSHAQAVCDTNAQPTSSICGPGNNVSFVLPTTNTDGSSFNDFATARVIFGNVSPLCSAQGVPVVGATVKDVGNLGVPPTPLINTRKAVLLGTLGLANGSQNITAQVINVVGTVSGCANVASFTYQGKTPSSPTGVQAGP